MNEPRIRQLLQYQSDFMGYLMAMTRDFDAAEEIFQNVAVIMLQENPEEEEIRDFRAWAKEVVRRQALYYLRDKAKISTRVQPVVDELLELVSQAFMEDETPAKTSHREIAALQHCLDKVAPTERAMLALRYEEKASFSSISDRIRISPGAVQRALSRLRKRLHDCVQSRGRTDLEVMP